MNREKLLQNPLPINRDAARVVKRAKPEDVWRPMPKDVGMKSSAEFLAVAPIPKSAPRDLEKLCGQRRDRLVIVGYAAEQGSKSQQAKWVVRCDCGNYEHRTRILRWIGTQALDMCRECRTRAHKLKGQWSSPERAIRATKQAAI